MMNRLILLSLVLLTGMASCNKSYQPPVFKHIANIQLSNVVGEIVSMKADVILYNPNDIKVKPKSVDINVFIKDRKVATMREKYSFKIQPLSEFSLPMNIVLDISKLGLLNSILGFIQGEEFQAHYVGNAKVVIHGIPVNIPIDYHDVLKLR